MVYLDDITIYSKTRKEHLKLLEEVFKRLRKAGLKVKPSKCHFMKQEVKLLGHKVSENGIKADKEKTEVVKEFPIPRTRKEVRSFLGLTGMG